MNKIPTATEFIRNKFPKHNGVFVLRNIEEFMIEFAKFHVKAALKAAYDNIEYTTENSSVPYVVGDSILKSYPLTNII
jgi:hypothetical protein